MAQKVNTSLEAEVKARNNANKLWSVIGPFQESFTYIFVGISILMGGYLYRAQVLTLGTIFAFILYFQQFGGPLQQFAGFFSNIQGAVVSGERILMLLKQSPDIVDGQNVQPLKTPNGKIEFRDVSFAYQKEDVLKHISVDIQAKQRVAIVGPTGAGKTTFASLIPRFYDINRGEILIDNSDLKSYTIASVRNQIGIVLQDSYLFAVSVIDNIRFGRRDATDEEIYEITKKIGIHDFILSLPQGYQTLVGERGAILSVGQAQLIAIARTLLADPPILILDEATSSVDIFSEVLIQKALDELLRARTCIIIAHRLSTIVSADKILVMDQGKIIQEGSHAQLVKQEGMYKQFYLMQFSENQLAAPPDKN